MNLLAKLVVLGLGSSCAWAAIIDGTSSGRAENVTIVNMEVVGGVMTITFSGPLSQGPACAAQHKNALVIGNGDKSAAAQQARHMFQLGQGVKVRGSGSCNQLSGYESLSSIEPMDAGRNLLY
jgi:hypothetical protein